MVQIDHSDTLSKVVTITFISCRGISYVYTTSNIVCDDHQWAQLVPTKHHIYSHHVVQTFCFLTQSLLDNIIIAGWIF